MNQQSKKWTVCLAAATLVAFMAWILMFDGGQAVMANALRGRGDTWVTTGLQTFAFVGVMVPVAWVSAFVLNRGVIGLYEAILIATALSLVLLCGRFVQLSRRKADALDGHPKESGAFLIRPAVALDGGGTHVGVGVNAGIFAETLSLDSIVGKRPDLAVDLDTEEDRCVLRFSQRELRLPRRVLPALQFATTSDRFVVRDLPGRLDDAGKMTLVRRLLKEGLLQVRGRL